MSPLVNPNLSARYLLRAPVGYISTILSPDGKTAASVCKVGNSDSENVFILLWDVATQQPLGPPLTGHKAPVTGLAFSPDGRVLASSSMDGIVMLWDTSVESWQARACRIANRNLSENEWRRFFDLDIDRGCTCPGLPPCKGVPPDVRASTR